MKRSVPEVDNIAEDVSAPDVLGGPGCNGAAKGGIRYLMWLSDGLLLLAGSIELETGSRLPATVTSGECMFAGEAWAVPYGGPGDSVQGGSRGRFVMVKCEPGIKVDEIPQRVVLGGEPSPTFLESTQLPQRQTDLITMLRDTVAGLDAARRALIVNAMAHAAAERLSGPCAMRTSRSLYAIREALRERLPGPSADKRNLLEGSVDSLLKVDASTFCLIGWIASAWPLTRVTAVTPEGYRIELLERLFRYHRPDLDGMYAPVTSAGDLREVGFFCYFQLDVPSLLEQGWLIELTNAAGEDLELHVPAAETDQIQARNVLIGQMDHAAKADSGLLVDHLEPAICRLQENRRVLVRIRKLVQYGTPPKDPVVTIIVPLFGRVDFMEQQLAQFANDPEISNADLIYVLDSPELSEATLNGALWLERLYRIPFRVAALVSNVGFSGANNAGVALARGRLLLLLNADVLPERPGWLGKMVRFYETTPNIGVLGPKLLFEDDAVQHAGLFFSRHPTKGFWRNEHYYKGLHRTLPLANVTRKVPAVTGACLMTAKALYDEMGGLSGMYIQGDFEDSDFCLRVLKSGRVNWYLPDVELYHLEGQSYPPKLRQLVWRYNAWLHTHLWGDFIGEVMEEFKEP
jgi:GT2 family glycosyltransferase